MNRFILFAASFLLLCTSVVISLAADVGEKLQDTVLINSELNRELDLGLGGAGKALGDSLLLASYDFQDENMQPDQQGWISIDKTDNWNISTFNCANLDATPENHAWWCGDESLCCGSGDQPGGYGQFYNIPLSWSGAVVDPEQETTVRVTANINYDLEINFDYLYLEYLGETGWLEVHSFTGIYDNFSVDEVFSLPVAAYVEGQIHLRWRVYSDGGYDAEDCDYPNDGAAQIDNITVFFTQGSNDPVQMGEVETCEPGSTPAWLPGRVGNFAKVWESVADPDNFNDTPRWAFIDDGVVEPESAGYLGTPGNDYAPGGFVVNPEGGLLGPGHFIWNEVWSPPIAWPAGNYTGGVFEFERFIHVTLPGALVFPKWAVRSTAALDGLSGWSEWIGDPNYYFGGPDTHVHQKDFSTSLVANCTFVQVALIIKQEELPQWNYYVEPELATPTAYFDNVKVTAYEAGSFQIDAAPYNLARDAFPSSGGLDEVDLSANSARFDAVRTNNVGDILDYLLVSMTPLGSSGSVQSAVMHYLIDGDPAYDSVRLHPSTGTAIGTIWYGDTFEFDLPDEGLLFPGDVVHYYFEASDGVVTTTWPADLAAFETFTPESAWLEYFTMRVLPSHRSTGGHPPILLWDDSNGYAYSSTRNNTWPTPLVNSGLAPGVDFDIFTSRDSRQDYGTGLGGSATTLQISGYETILYSGGRVQFYPPLCDDSNCQGDDIGVLDAWLLQGGKNLVLSGFNIVRSGPTAFMDAWPSVTSAGELSDPAGFTVNATSPFLVFDAGDTWSLPDDPYHPYDAINTTENSVPIALFEGLSFPGATLSENNNAQVILFPYDLMFVAATDPGKDAALMEDILDNVLIYLDYGAVPTFLQTFTATTDDGAINLSWSIGIPADATQFRVTVDANGQTWDLSPELASWNLYTARDDSPQLLTGGEFTYTLAYAEDSEHWLILDKTSVNLGPKLLRTELTAVHPNPFNPCTKICFSVARNQKVHVAVFDVSGRHVIDLAQEVFPAGHHELEWHGKDAEGLRQSSGAYFVRLTTEAQVDVRKVLMLK